MVKKGHDKKEILHYYLPLLQKKYVWKYAFSDLEMQSIDVIKYRINM